MNKMSTALRAGLLAVVTTLALAATASAERPGAITVGSQSVGPDRATLVANVDANDLPTVYFFEYGKNRRYGSRTPDMDAGNARNPRRVNATVEGLEPNTLYHFRVVARNRDGVRAGTDRTFKTKPQPLGLQISTTPNPVVFGNPTAVFGALSGTGNSNRRVQLQQKGFPFTADWQNLGNPIVTDDNGAFSIPVLPLALSTQFRVRLVSEDVFSPIITQAVAVRVNTRVSKRRVRRGKRVRIFGTIEPARVGVPFEIQKQLKTGEWKVIRRSITRTSSDTTRAKFGRKVRVPRTARYRVFVNTTGGDIVANFGAEKRIKVKRSS